MSLFMNQRATTEVRMASPKEVAAEIHRALNDGGSAEHEAGVQWVFQDGVESHRWFSAAWRRAAVRFRRDLRKEHGLGFLIDVADQLFSGSVLEEKVAAVFLLGELVPAFADGEF